MICILSALKAESDPLINYFKLAKDTSFSFPVFLNNNIALVAIGVGTVSYTHLTLPTILLV